MTEHERLRALCAGLPGAEERLSHGSPTWFAGGKTFVSLHDHSHGDAHLALWCAAAEGEQTALVAARPEHCFVPPYVGGRGWLGVRLDTGLAWDEVEEHVLDAYREVAPRRLLAQLEEPT